MIYRMTQRRFSNLDENLDEIKWPELQPDGQTVSAGLSTLNPAATRRTGGAGFEMEKDDASEWGDESPRLGVRPGVNETQYFDQPYEYSGNAGVGNGNNGGGSQRGSYCTSYSRLTVWFRRLSVSSLKQTILTSVKLPLLTLLPQMSPTLHLLLTVNTLEPSRTTLFTILESTNRPMMFPSLNINNILTSRAQGTTRSSESALQRPNIGCSVLLSSYSSYSSTSVSIPIFNKSV